MEQRVVCIESKVFNNINFKVNKIYVASYENDIVHIQDDFGIKWKFDINWKKDGFWQHFSPKWKNLLFYEHFVTLEEMRKNKLNKISEIW